MPELPRCRPNPRPRRGHCRRRPTRPPCHRCLLRSCLRSRSYRQHQGDQVSETLCSDAHRPFSHGKARIAKVSGEAGLSRSSRTLLTLRATNRSRFGASSSKRTRGRLGARGLHDRALVTLANRRVTRPDARVHTRDTRWAPSYKPGSRGWRCGSRRPGSRCCSLSQHAVPLRSTQSVSTVHAVSMVWRM